MVTVLPMPPPRNMPRHMGAAEDSNGLMDNSRPMHRFGESENEIPRLINNDAAFGADDETPRDSHDQTPALGTPSGSDTGMNNNVGPDNATSCDGSDCSSATSVPSTVVVIENPEVGTEAEESRASDLDTSVGNGTGSN